MAGVAHWRGASREDLAELNSRLPINWDDMGSSVVSEEEVTSV